jgi:regulator of protease activity HflC (stomatin/prohibitin superfamily)
MLDRLFDFLAQVWEWLIPWAVIDQYEMGVVLRWGKFNRVINPGFRWLIPLGIESVKYETVVRQTSYLDVQSLTSLDGKPVTISAILVFTISDIRKFLLDIDEGETDLQNMCYGVIAECVETSNWHDIISMEFNKQVQTKCRRVSENYCGVKLLHVKYSDKATARNIRLWND